MKKIILSFLLLIIPVQVYSASVTLAWIAPSNNIYGDPIPATNLGYMVFCGMTSRVYSTSIDVGNCCTTTIANLQQNGNTYYFAVKSYYLSRRTNQSDYSQEAVWTAAVPDVRLAVDSAYGGAYPGTVTAGYGTTISEWVTNSPVIIGSNTYICTGAIVSGNTFTQISPTNVVLVLTNNAVIMWQWELNVHIQIPGQPKWRWVKIK